MLLSFILSLNLQATAPPDWRPFAVGEFGFGSSAIAFDAARLERRGGIVRVWTVHSIHYSGRTPSRQETRYDLDCARRTTRRLETVDHPTPGPAVRPLRRRAAGRPQHIAGNGPLTLLAARLCDGAGPAETGAWAWLNIADGEGPDTRFSYEDLTRRDGQRLQFWVRYAHVDPQRLGALRNDRALAAERISARLEINCLARTTRTLEQVKERVTGWPEHVQTPAAAAAPILPNTREAVLMGLRCPMSPTPVPANVAEEE